MSAAGFVTKKIGNKKRSLSSILKAARTKAGYSLEQAEAETRVAQKYLLALERGDYSHMPAEAYNIGYIRCYAEFLGLDPERIVQLYRLERSSHNLTPSHASQLRPKRAGDWNFLITPKLLGVVGVIAVFGAVSGYILFQVKKFADPPMLELTNVPTEFTSDKDTVVLEGHTAQGATVSMNSEPIFVSNDGSFSQDVQLSPGLNQILVQSKSRADKESRLIVKVLYNPDLAKLTPQKQGN